MSQYTPGPWKVLENSDSSIWAVRPAQPLAEAFVLEEGGQGDFAANARLMAAAPELLEALHEIQRFAGICLLVIDRFGGRAVDLLESELRRAAVPPGSGARVKAAIAKAVGAK
ncbi:MAG TPA: hypothetical protein VE178_21165 [Silvibacterium sp.]|nr:hypothetical protein [Silvibacterium sp.]